MVDQRGALCFYIFFIEGISLSYLFRFFPDGVLLFLILQILFIFLRKKKSLFYLSFVLPLAFLYGVLSFSSRVDQGEYERLAASFNRDTAAYHRVSIVNLPVQTEYGFLYECDADHLKSIKGVKKYFFSAVAIEPGYAYEGYVRTSVRAPRRNPGEHLRSPVINIHPEGEMLKYRARGLLSQVQRLRWRVYRFLHERYNRDTASLLSAIVLGHRGTNRELYTAYARTGLAHLMSVSGTHFGLFTIVAFFIVRAFAMLLPYRMLIRLTRRLSLKETGLLLILPVLLFYLLLSGMRIPAIRAFVMINLFIAGVFLGRRGSWLVTVLFAGFLILLLNPAAIVEPSMQLSFVAVLSIGFAMEYASRYTERIGKSKVLRILFHFTVITVSAFAGTLPLSLYYFHGTSSIGIVANILITPVVCFILLPLGIFSTIVFLLSGYFPMAELIGTLSGMINNVVISLSGLSFSFLRTGGFPFLFVPLAYLIGISLLRGWKRLLQLSLLTLVIAVIVTYGANRVNYPIVTFLDVGQGDSAVIETDTGRTIVIDTGHSGREVLQYLTYRGKDRIDALVLSHAGGDHAGGLWNILKQMRVSELWDNGLILYKPDIERLTVHRRLRAGDIMRYPGGRFEVLHPYEGYYCTRGDEENNSSLVLRYVNEKFSVLFTGDVEADAEETIMAMHLPLKADILKVAHHGSHTSTTGGFLKRVRPALAVISVGADNMYGHPHPETLDKLAGLTTLRTDRDGAIRVYSAGDTIRYSTYSDAMIRPVGLWDFPGEIRNLKRIFTYW